MIFGSCASGFLTAAKQPFNRAANPLCWVCSVSVRRVLNSRIGSLTKPKPRWELHFAAMAKAWQFSSSVRRLGLVKGFGSDVSLHPYGELARRRIHTSSLGLGLLFPATQRGRRNSSPGFASWSPSEARSKARVTPGRRRFPMFAPCGFSPAGGSFMPHAELSTSCRMNTSGCRS